MRPPVIFLLRYWILPKGVPGSIRAEYLVDGPEEVLDHLCLLGVAALAGGNKIVEVDVHLYQGCCSPVLWGFRQLPVVYQIRGAVICLRAGDGTALQRVWGGSVTDWHGLVSQVCDHLRRHAKIWGAVHPPHGQGQMEPHDMFVVWVQLG